MFFFLEYYDEGVGIRYKNYKGDEERAILPAIRLVKSHSCCISYYEIRVDNLTAI